MTKIKSYAAQSKEADLKPFEIERRETPKSKHKLIYVKNIEKANKKSRK